MYGVRCVIDVFPVARAEQLARDDLWLLNVSNEVQLGSKQHRVSTRTVGGEWKMKLK